MSEIYSRRHDYFRALMQDARKKAGLTQSQLAERLGKPQSFVSKYESGERRLDVLEFHDVARVLGINVRSFFVALDRSGE